MKKLLFFLSLLFFCGVFVHADVPKKLNLQGKLTSDSGQVLAGKPITTAVLHLRQAGSSIPNNMVDTQTNYSTDSNGLYSINFNVTNFNFDSGADFKVVLTVDGQSIPTEWASIATNPYSFYSSTATYARILDPNQTEKLVDGNFNPSVIYKINVATAVAISTSSYVAGNSYVWGIGTDGVQKWTSPDIQVSTAAYAINAGTATYSNASSYSLNSGTATYATTIANGSVTTLKVADANITPAKLTQSDYGNVYKIKVDTATYAVNATTATFVIGSGLPNGSVTTLKIADANVTPAKLTQSDYVNVYKIKVDTATYAVNATTAYALSSNFKLVDGNFTAGHVYTSTSAYATNAGIATIAEDLSDGIIETSHFKYTGPGYAETYNIKVATAVYAETGGADLAEIYASTELLTPGDVVSIDTTKDNSIVKTKVAEDTLVAGVISTKPGLLMNKTEKGYELALVGKVPTKVCNEGGSIKRGDLLVSASIQGYAKKAGDNPKTGTVIGKALENFDSVNGTILVLVNLQ